MTEKVHYDNKIFFLTTMIRVLTDGIRIKVDAEYFAEKILEDALFINISIQKIYFSLKDNTQLIRRKSYLHTVMKLKRAYGRLLDEILTAEGELGMAYDGMRSKIRLIAATHINDVKIIRNELGKQDATKIDSDMISYDELHFLMSPIEGSTDK